MIINVKTPLYTSIDGFWIFRRGLLRAGRIIRNLYTGSAGLRRGRIPLCSTSRARSDVQVSTPQVI